MLKYNKLKTSAKGSYILPRISWISGVFLIFYISILAGGGAARTDVLSLLYLRPVALIASIVYFGHARASVTDIKIPLILLGIFAAILLCQIIPLPPAAWAAMPGHQGFSYSNGFLKAWRPSSISPDRTLNSLVSLVVPLAALVATHHFSKSKRFVIAAVIIGGLVSGAMAMVQLASGESSNLYLYRVTTDGAVGLFSNPNHQAVMLVCLLPVIAFWLASSPNVTLPRELGVVGLMCLILLLIMVTGSRSGLVMSCVGLFCAFALHDAFSRRTMPAMRQRYRTFYVLACIFAIVLAVLAIVLGRNLAVVRMSQLDMATDLRVADFQIFMQLAKEYFLFGSGAGTFDPAFRIVEPASMIKNTYVNHAHNDLIETVITLGLPGLLLLTAFVGWFVSAMIQVMKAPHRDRDGYAALGGVLIIITLLASLTDYLLRTPLMDALFAVACAWLSMGSVAARDAREARVIASRSQLDTV